MNIYVGIDPSINSTGLCIKYDNKIEFYIIKGGHKLTKKEQTAQDTLLNFDYICYDKYDLKDYDNHLSEYYKTQNLIMISNIIKDILNHKRIDNNNKIYIVMEGISYGSSIRTKAIYDLAGLNFIIRSKLINKENINLTIGTPAEIKKFATGNGNCKKDVINEMFIALFPELKIIPKIDDIADAYMMAMYAEKINEDLT